MYVYMYIYGTLGSVFVVRSCWLRDRRRRCCLVPTLPSAAFESAGATGHTKFQSHTDTWGFVYVDISYAHLINIEG